MAKQSKAQKAMGNARALARGNSRGIGQVARSGGSTSS